MILSHFTPVDQCYAVPWSCCVDSCFCFVEMAMFTQRRSRAILARARAVPRNADQVASEAFLGGWRGAQQYRGVAKASGPLRFFVFRVGDCGMCSLVMRGRCGKRAVISLVTKTSEIVTTSILVMKSLENDYRVVKGLGYRNPSR